MKKLTAMWTVLTLVVVPAAVVSPALADAVVGNGNPVTCTEGALESALSAGGSVTFNCGSNPLALLLTTAKTIATDTTIDGGGLITLSAAGCQASPVLEVPSGVTFTVEGITLIDSRSTFINNDGTLSLTSSSMSGNGADPISNTGLLNISSSTFSNNGAGGVAGAIFNSGNTATATITNSSFSNNRASAGAIYHNNTATVIGCTFARNWSRQGAILNNQNL